MVWNKFLYSVTVRRWRVLTLSFPKVISSKVRKTIRLNFILQNCQTQTAPLENTAQQLSFEWSHTRVLSTDSKVTTTFIDSRFDSESEKVKRSPLLLSLLQFTSDLWIREFGSVAASPHSHGKLLVDSQGPVLRVLLRLVQTRTHLAISYTLCFYFQSCLSSILQEWSVNADVKEEYVHEMWG